MSRSRPTTTTSDTTQPSEIPTAIHDEAPFFGDDETEDKTLDVTMSESDGATPDLKKFRRPTKSEIMDAVDQVNTESIDVLELHQARTAQGETDDVDADDVD